MPRRRRRRLFRPKLFNAFAQLRYRKLLLAEAEVSFYIAALSDGGTSLVTNALFQTIFASYAREDLEVVECVASIITALGLGELRWDLNFLRAGDDWKRVILMEINKADSFQLFWSEHARASRYVRMEWKHANHYPEPIALPRP